MKLKLFSTVAFLLLAALGLSAAKPQIVAHRGVWKADGSAQNSIRGLIKADSIGVDAIELDVWISSDDVIFLNHDASINGVVLETSDAKTISKCKLKNGENVPTLEAFLDVAKDLKPDLVIELKPHQGKERENLAVSKIIDMVAERGLTDRTTYITFSRNAFDHLVAMSGRPVQFLTAVHPEVLEEIGGECAGADYHISAFRSNPTWIKQLHDMGKKVNIWTVDKPADIQFCIDHQADFITTNEPELAAEMVEKAYGERPLKVMTYNLRFGELSDMDGLAEAIKAANPDFVALQEVDVNTNRDAAKHNNGLNYVTELAQRTGLFGYYARTINFGPGYYGIGLLSRYPAEKIEKFELPNPGNQEPRVLLKGVFEMPGQKIVFASTHLDYADHETRKQQARFVVDRMKESEYPALVAGDFNAEPNSIYAKTFSTEMIDLTNTTKTWPADKPNEKLDYIFGYPREAFSKVGCFVPEPSKKSPSDHLPVISDITVKY